jgi:formate hydrogenlyase transcriptional activator
MDALVRYPWPGNVRELQNIIERAVILSAGPTLQVPLCDLQSAPAQTQPQTASIATPVTLCDAEREHILGALDATRWVVGGPRGAAARLGMKRSTLQKKMQKLGIARPSQSGECPDWASRAAAASRREAGRAGFHSSVRRSHEPMPFGTDTEEPPRE